MQVHYRFFGFFRLLLALMVVLQHALPAFVPAGLSARLAPLEIGSVAVLLFFVLSGFIVVEAAMLFYERRASAFLANRLIRIYPPYVVAVLLTVLVSAAVMHLGGESALIPLFGAWPDHSAQNIFASLVGILPLVSKLLTPAGSDPILILAWALRIELVFYGVVCLALAMGRTLNQPAARLLGAAAIAFLCVDEFWLKGLHGNGLEYTPYFVLGASTYYAITPASTRRRALAIVLVLVSVFLIARHIGSQDVFNEKARYQRDLGGQCLLFFTGLSVWLALIAVPSFWPAVSEAVRAADQTAGELTYPVYLTHMTALVPCLWLLPADSPASLLLALAACLGMAVVMHEVVEQRLSALRRRVRGQGTLPARDVAIV